MSELEDTLSSVLSDPAAMERIAGLASQLMGGEASPAGPPSGDKAALLEALLPYLRPERQARLKKALRMARLARLAGRALEEYGGGDDV